MKKIIALLLVLIMVCTMVACGANVGIYDDPAPVSSRLLAAGRMGCDEGHVGSGFAFLPAFFSTFKNKPGSDVLFHDRTFDSIRDQSGAWS